MAPQEQTAARVQEIYSRVQRQVYWFLTATLVAIDMTLAGLYWALGHATGQGDDVMAKLIRKVLYVGAFAYIIGNFNMLASIVFRSFAGLGLTRENAEAQLDQTR